MKHREVIANVTVGKPQISPSSPSHVPGARAGNEPHHLRNEPGIQLRHDGSLRASPRRSTGIRAKDRCPIDPRMPILSPA
jgi:hypothetical protein